MQLTRHTDYALRILMYLAAEQDRLASVADIAHYYSISRNHLVKVVQGLTEYGFVITTRGKGGGMKLARNASDISIGDVIRHMENNFDLVECFNEENSVCTVDKRCTLKGILRRGVNNFLSELDTVSLADIINRNLRKQLVDISFQS